MAKRKAGLHKEITAIFGGAPIEKNKGAQQPPNAPTPDGTGYEEGLKHDKGLLETPLPPKPPAPASQIPKPPTPASQIPKPAAPASSILEPSKREEPVKSLPKAIPVEQPKVGTTVRDARQAPWQRTLQQIKDRLFAPKRGVNTGRQKAMAVLVPVLFVVLIFVFAKVLGGPKGKVQVPTKPGPVNVAAGSVGKIDWQIPDPYPTTLRDPMQFGLVTPAHPQTDQPGTDKLIVTGIINSEGDLSALIGTQIVRVGEEVFGATVVKINRDSVEFEMNGKKWTQKVGL